MLARGELRCIGATTLAEYRQYIEKDAALERRFQQVSRAISGPLTSPAPPKEKKEGIVAWLPSLGSRPSPRARPGAPARQSPPHLPLSSAFPP